MLRKPALRTEVLCDDHELDLAEERERCNYSHGSIFKHLVRLHHPEKPSTN